MTGFGRLTASVEAEAARAILEKAAGRRLQPGFLRRVLSGNNGHTRRRKLELIHLPCRVVVEWGGSRSTSDADHRISVLVDGFARTARLLRPAEVGQVREQDGEPEFAYPLTDEETREIARSTLLGWRLNRLIRARAGEERQLEFGGLVDYPFWTLFFEDGRTARVGFRMVDAVTGKLDGTVARQALLDALDSVETNDPP